MKWVGGSLVPSLRFGFCGMERLGELLDHGRSHPLILLGFNNFPVTFKASRGLGLNQIIEEINHLKKKL